MCDIPFIRCKQSRGSATKYGTFKTPVNTNPDPEVGLFELPVNYLAEKIEIKIYEERGIPKYTFTAMLHLDSLTTRRKTEGGLIPRYYSVVLPYETLYVELYFKVQTYPRTDHVSIYLVNFKYRATKENPS